MKPDRNKKCLFTWPGKVEVLEEAGQGFADVVVVVKWQEVITDGCRRSDSCRHCCSTACLIAALLVYGGDGCRR